MSQSRCKDCNTYLVPIFNMVRCPYGCEPNKKGDVCRFPNWWSHYAGVPSFLRVLYPNRSNEDIFRVADCVAVFDRTGSIYTGDAKITESRVLVIKNTTWDRSVGKFFDLSPKQEKVLCEQAEELPDVEAKRYNRERMVCLIRS